MISVTDYMEYAEVRAVLGVSIYELPDDTLALNMYAQTLQTRLAMTTGTFSGTTGSLMAIYDTINALASPTSDQENFMFLVRLFAIYVVAEACLPGLSLLALKSESDGKTTQTRFSAEATFKDVAMNVRQQLNSLSGRIDQTLNSGASVVLPTVSRTPPSFDRVTNV